jgi:acetyltransferase-like isoleucine patch superfamily enzyme
MTKYFVHETAIIDDGAIIGDESKIWHFSHIRSSSRIGSNVIIGKNVYVDINVIIGSNVKIQNNVSVYSGVTIEDNVFVGPHVVFTNDLKPRAVGEWKIVKTQVNSGASIGANSVIICGTTLGSNCMIGAGSVVTKSVPSHALVFGNPAKFHGVVCVCGEKLSDSSTGENTYSCTHCGNKIKFSPNNFS